MWSIRGRYGDQVLEDVVGLGRNYFNEGMLAHQGDVNLMKGAIMASTYVTTVSPTYAQSCACPSTPTAWTASSTSRAASSMGS